MGWLGVKFMSRVFDSIEFHCGCGCSSFIYVFLLHCKLVIAFNCAAMGSGGWKRKVLQRGSWVAVFCVKECADFVEVVLVDLACDIFGLLAKNTHLCSIIYHILFNKINSFCDVLVKIDIHNARTCSSIMLEFHMGTCNSF